MNCPQSAGCFGRCRVGTAKAFLTMATTLPGFLNRWRGALTALLFLLMAGSTGSCFSDTFNSSHDEIGFSDQLLDSNLAFTLDQLGSEKRRIETAASVPRGDVDLTPAPEYSYFSPRLESRPGESSLHKPSARGPPSLSS